MSADDDLKRAVLDAVLVRAPKEGFTPAVLKAAQRDAGEEMFAGIGEVIAFWSGEVDRTLAARLNELHLTQLPVRQRIREAVLARLQILKPHKDAARKAAAALAMPQYAGLGAELVWHSADVMWRAAGDLSTDFNYYSKRTILAGVISSTMLAWFGDDSEDEAPTGAFLDARIANVMTIEKLKARVQDACSFRSAS